MAESATAKMFATKTAFAWTLKEHPQKRYIPKLDWGTFFPDGGGTRARRTALRESSQQLLDVLVNNLLSKKADASPLTVFQYFVRIRTLANWMAAQEIWRYSALDADDIQCFLNDRANSKEGMVGKKAIEVYEILLFRMWKFRVEYKGGLRCNPRTVVVDESSRLNLRRGKGWDPLPETDALYLLQDAIQWAEEVADIVGRVIEALMLQRGQLRGKSKEQRKQILAKVYASLSLTEDFQAIARAVNDPELRPDEVVRSAYRLTLGAAVALMFGLVGLRSGEVEAFRRDCLSMNEDEVHVLTGVPSKKGAVVRDWPTTSLVAFAVACIRTVSPCADADGTLFQAFTGNAPLPWTGVKTMRMRQNELAKLLRGFANGTHRKVSIDSYLHPHRLRHTFATFSMKRDKRRFMSRALADHYGHVDTYLIDTVYTSRDFEMMGLLDEAQHRELEAALTDVLASPTLAGKGASTIRAARDEVSSGSFQGELSLEGMVEALIRKGVSIAPCSWGYCLYESNASACQGSKRRPNAVRRNASLCSGCANFAVTQEYRPFWEDRFASDEQFLMRSDIPEQSRNFVNDRHRRTVTILRELNEERRP